MKFLMCLLLMATVVGCSKDVDEDVISGSIYLFTASCQAYTTTSADSFCVEYGLDFFSDSSMDCSTQESYYSGLGYDVAGSNYSSGEESPECPKVSLSGSCTLSNHRIFYYNSEFTAGEAQTECNTLGGDFE